MANKLYEEQSVQNIANAIRTKNGLSTTYKIAEMAQAILDIPTGGGTNYLPTVCNDASSYTLPSGALTGVTNIREYMFYGAKITSISLPSGLTSVGNSAFQGSSLTQIDFPASVTSLGDSACQGTTGKTFIFRGTTPPTIGTQCFGASATEISNSAIYVPDDYVNTYKQASGWGPYTNIIHPISEI